MWRYILINKLNEVFDKVLSSINESKTEIFEITEEIHNEYKELQIKIEIIKEKVQNIIKEVDGLEVLEKNSRKKLLKVSRDFTVYTELDIHKAYEEANILQIQLNVKREEEKKLLQQRSEMEIRLKRLGETLDKAENLTSRISIVEEFLGSTFKDIHSTVEDMKQSHIFGRKIINAQEEERKRIAREIHDGPAQSLAGLVIKAEICNKLLDIDTDKARVELHELRECTRESIKDIRKIIYNLRPTAIDDLGLIPSLERYIENFENETKIPIDFTIFSKNDLNLNDSIKNLSIFRIIQEALNNIAKHSKATNVKVNINIDEENIYLDIMDNGIGFDLESVKSESREDRGFGLLNIEERVKLLRGNLIIETEKGKGTLIKVQIPTIDKKVGVEI